jgi:cytochrome c556
MSRIARGLAAAAVLALGICCAASSPGRGAGDEEEARAVKEARQGILQLTKMNGGAARTQAKAIADAARKAAGGADEGLKFVMRANKAKAKGGVGVGPKGESIELKIIALSKRVSPADAAQSEDLGQIADISKAIAEVAVYYTPKAGVAGKDPKDWTKFTDAMKRGSEELAKAAKGGKAPEIKQAASYLNASCTNCHSTFRD